MYLVSQPKEVVAPVEESIPVAPLPQSTDTSSVEENSDTVQKTSETPSTAVKTSVSQTPTVTSPKTSAKPTPSLPFSAVVVYDGDRFIPDKVTVIAGGAVRFVNTSNQEMWIASDNHPTHTRYPVKSETDCKGSSFDQCAAIGSGESWSFTFTRTGTWGYHNHIHAQDTGDVVVRTEEEYLKSL